MKENSDELASVHALVYRRVQGVYYRAFVHQHAVASGLKSYVRNLRQPTAVEVAFEGRLSGLKSRARLPRRGPARAIVAAVDLDWAIQQWVHAKS